MEMIFLNERPWTKHVVEGNPKEIEIPLISLQDLLKESVKKYRDHTAISFFEKSLTYGELYGSIQKITSSLKKKGVKKGDRVALMLPNCPQYPISYYAALTCGATVVQVNPMYKSSELVYILQDTKASVLIVFDQLYPVVEQIMDQVNLADVITVSFNGSCTFTELLEDQGDQVPDIVIDPKEDVAVLQYTGGTTGRAKGAMLTHYNIVANTLQSAATSKVTTNFGEERVLGIIPLFHVYGMTSCMTVNFYSGGNLILVPKFEIEQVVEVIEKFKPTSFPGVPTMYIAILDYYRKRKFDLSSLNTCISGSAPLPIEVLNQLHSVTGTTTAEGYGLSEASPVTHRNPVRGLQKVGSIGIPIPNTDAKIVDIATGENEMPIGEVGELLIQGPQIMKGYLNNPEETAQTLKDGWLFTGDLAKMDEDGFFYIVGRKKELIIASGFNVYPIEIEDVIYSHPKVLEAAVMGIPDPYRGETIKAFVVLKEEEELAEKELIEFCKEKLASFKVPRSITFLEELPKTAVGKVLKRKLKEQLTQS